MGNENAQNAFQEAKGVEDGKGMFASTDSLSCVEKNKSPIECSVFWNCTITTESRQSIERQAKMQKMFSNFISEIAAFKHQQALLEQAAQQGLHGFAHVASHDAIETRMEQASKYLTHLEQQGNHEKVEAFLRCDDLWEYMQRQQEPGSR